MRHGHKTLYDGTTATFPRIVSAFHLLKCEDVLGIVEVTSGSGMAAKSMSTANSSSMSMTSRVAPGWWLVPAGGIAGEASSVFARFIGLF
mmetsp:Transcript_8198/g.12967  ORF Transcript_8198/g.12967 Transcript_8198/m.12967 type:complete len:90 (-) Transcript_8198:556-825(-)